MLGPDGMALTPGVIRTLICFSRFQGLQFWTHSKFHTVVRQDVYHASSEKSVWQTLDIQCIIYIYLSIPIVSYYILINGYYGCFPHILRPIHSYISPPTILGQFPAHSLKADFVTYSASIRLCESLGCVLQQKWAAGILKPCSLLLRR